MHVTRVITSGKRGCNWVTKIQVFKTLTPESNFESVGIFDANRDNVHQA